MSTPEPSAATVAYEAVPPTPDCEPYTRCPMTDNGAYHGVCRWHEGAERTCTCGGRIAHPPPEDAQETASGTEADRG